MQLVQLQMKNIIVSLESFGMELEQSIVRQGLATGDGIAIRAQGHYIAGKTRQQFVEQGLPDLAP